MGPGNIITQHDVLPDAWYLDGGKAPVSISIEAGQADLFLCAWLGIDHIVQGRRRYRLLDAKVTFHRSLPGPGETIEYHISIDRFLRQGEVYLFFFHYQGFIGNRLFISMRDGCAGFFTEKEVKHSGGIVLKKQDLAATAPADPFAPLVRVFPTAFNDDQVHSLRKGDLAGAFGPDFTGICPGKAQHLPGGPMHLIDRVLSFDPTGGRFGMGAIIAEADIHPDAWFLTCHFIDDPVMPGTLMYECCAHALRIFVQRMGWASPDDQVHFDVLPGNESDLKCRGPVTPETKKARYEIEIKQMGYTDADQTPFVIADAHMFADDLRIVLYRDMGMTLSGISRDALNHLWRQT
jgi:3-hydroxymyristoyl/3-hydroxydecanoyl-(acyl carrier protein) dehydratase